jgi:ribonuclease Z
VIFHAHDLKESKVIYEDKKITVTTMIMKHSIPCCGFLFKEKQGSRKLIKDEIAKYDIPIAEFEKIKAGSDFITTEGNIIRNDQLSLPPLPPRTYACCADTKYSEGMLEQIKGADLLYHEATFTEDMRDRAKQTMHSTAKDAATIAQKAQVGKLVISHFSARYKDLEPLLDEAKSIFPNTVIAEEGMKISVEHNLND